MSLISHLPLVFFPPFLGISYNPIECLRRIVLFLFIIDRAILALLFILPFLAPIFRCIFSCELMRINFIPLSLYPFTLDTFFLLCIFPARNLIFTILIRGPDSERNWENVNITVYHLRNMPWRLHILLPSIRSMLPRSYHLLQH